MIIVLSSVTYALKAQKLLALERIYSEITKSVKVRAVRGCGYGLRLRKREQLNDALAVLERNGIKSLGVVEA